jgi:hypothetical protein
VKARKRGNDVDARRVEAQFRILKDAIDPYVQHGSRIRHTNAFYVTATVDPRLFDDRRSDAWASLGLMFNRMMANLRKALTCITVEIVDEEGRPRVREVRTRPKIKLVRSWESHESGWPHIHGILCIEWGPRGEPHWGIFQDSHGCWRAKNKNYFERAWPNGWIDVVALTAGTLEKNIQNVLWYVGKNLSDQDYRMVSSWPRKRLLTQSILWYTGKRSFSISRSLLEGDDKAPGDDLIERACITQTDLCGNVVEIEFVEWEFLGLVHRRHTELTRDEWAKVYPNPPDWIDACWKPYSSRESSAWGNSWTNGGS